MKINKSWLLSTVLVATPCLSLASEQHIAIAWPTPMQPVLLYRCHDSQCKALTSQDKVLYASAVPEQPKYKTPKPAPAPISFFSYTSSQNTSYKVFRQQSATTWTSCTFELDSDGKLVGGGSSLCTGAVATGNSTSSVTVLSFAAGNFAPNSDTLPSGASSQLNNPVTKRTITFSNKSQYKNICLSLNSQFVVNKGDTCKSVGGHVIPQNGSYKLTVTPNKKTGGGSVSGAAFISGFEDDLGWHYTGSYKQGIIYATAMEWTMFPTAAVSSKTPANFTDHTVGITTIDVSAVNGYNVAVSLSADNGAICSTATRSANGQANPSKYNYYSKVMAQLPVSGKELSRLCPDASQSPYGGSQTLKDKTQRFIGCLSPCKYVMVTKQPTDTINRACCAAGTKYSKSEVCTQATVPWGKMNLLHTALPYVDNLKHPNTQNVYRWQFDDYAGTLSCQPSASFTFSVHS